MQKAGKHQCIISAEYRTGVEGGIVRYQVMDYGITDRRGDVYNTSTRRNRNTKFLFRLKAGKKTEDFITVPRCTEGGVASIVVEDDSLIEDNDFIFICLESEPLGFWWLMENLGLQASESEVYFLERALAPFGSKMKPFPML